MSGRYRWNPGCPHQNSRCALTTGLDSLPAIWSRCPLPLQLTGVRDGEIIKRLPGERKRLCRCNQVEGQVNAGGFEWRTVN